MGVLALCRSPWPVVVEGGAALTVGASRVVLADADIADLEEDPAGDFQKQLTYGSLGAGSAHSPQTNMLVVPEDLAWTQALPGHHI